MARSQLARADRFYQNQSMRDEEWNRATQAPLWLMALTVAIVAAGFFVGVYSNRPYSTLGWIVGVVAILLYIVLGGMRRRQARRRLRQAHGQPA